MATLKKIVLVLLVALFSLQTNCSDRERLNPLDPGNPISHGAPTGLRLLPQRQAVTLQWSPLAVNDLAQYDIYRATETGGLAKYDSVPANSTQYTDKNLTYDTRYTYAVQAITDYDESRLSKTVSTVPGPFDFVLADYYGQSLLQVSYDGSNVLEFYEGYTATDLAVFQNRIYFTNLWDNSLKFIDPSGAVHSFALDDGPVDFAFDEKNSLIYVLGRDNNSLVTITFDGELRRQASLEMDVTFYTACSYDPLLDCLWLTDESLDHFYRYDLAGGVLTLIAGDIDGASDFVVDPMNGGGWLASYAGIVRVRADNSVVRFMPNHYIYTLAREKNTGLLYYAGYSTANDAWEIGYADETNHTVLSTSYAYIYKIITVPETIGTGLALIEGYDGQIIRLNARGEEIGRRSGIYGVTGIELH